jgi:hypothetical protein
MITAAIVLAADEALPEAPLPLKSRALQALFTWLRIREAVAFTRSRCIAAWRASMRYLRHSAAFTQAQQATAQRVSSSAYVSGSRKGGDRAGRKPAPATRRAASERRRARARAQASPPSSAMPRALDPDFLQALAEADSYINGTTFDDIVRPDLPALIAVLEQLHIAASVLEQLQPRTCLRPRGRCVVPAGTSACVLCAL